MTCWTGVISRTAPALAVGTMMVMQALVPALARLAAPSTVTLIGGTHNPLAPPAEYLQDVVLPVLARSAGMLAFDAARGAVVLTGGNDEGGSVNQTWALTSGGWVEDAPAVRPPARDSAAMVYDEARQELVMFGGTTTAGRIAEIWGYRQDAVAVVDDSCTGKDDLDGDDLVGCDDPDCWGACDPSCPPASACPGARPRCGDGACGTPRETIDNCPDDCESTVCGDGRCGSAEDDLGCPGDCAICGDLRCSAGAEDGVSCAVAVSYTHLTLPTSDLV